MSVLKTVRLGVAAALVMAMPLQAVGAAVRPSASIPAAASAVAAQDERDRGGMGLAWPAITVIVAAAILAIWLERDKKGARGTGFSR